MWCTANETNKYVYEENEKDVNANDVNIEKNIVILWALLALQFICCILYDDDDPVLRLRSIRFDEHFSSFMYEKILLDERAGPTFSKSRPALSVLSFVLLLLFF